MMNRIFAICIAVSMSFAVYAQNDVPAAVSDASGNGGALPVEANKSGFRNLILSMPNDVEPLLQTNDFADGIDYLEAGMTADITNTLRGKANFDFYSSNMIRLKPSPVSELAIRLLLTEGGDTLLCVVRSVVSSKIKDSSVGFYDSRWKKLDASKYVDIPKAEDFFSASLSGDDKAALVRKVDIPLVYARMLTEADEIDFSLSSLDYMLKDDADKVKPFVVEKLKYAWNGKRFALSEK